MKGYTNRDIVDSKIKLRKQSEGLETIYYGINHDLNAFTPPFIQF
jgi:hypothetical protein